MKPLLNRALGLLLLGGILIVAGCAHPINVSPLNTPLRDEAKLVKKQVAYVMTDELRNKVVTTSGGGGDKVSYYLYRDMEKALRDTLRSAYEEVTVIQSATQATPGTQLIFSPQLTSSSSSDSMLTWPPTQFFINLECTVTDPNGQQVTQLRLSGNGGAPFSEFKSDPGLAGRRAATDLATKLAKEIEANPALR
jgi:hypothetical protein